MFILNSSSGELPAVGNFCCLLFQINNARLIQSSSTRIAIATPTMIRSLLFLPEATGGTASEQIEIQYK